MKKSYLLVFGSFLFFIFLVFSFIALKDNLVRVDFDTTVKLQDNIPQRLVFPFSLFSVFGSFEVLTLFLIIVLLVGKGISKFLLFGSYTFLHIVEVIGKTFIAQDGPPYQFLKTLHFFSFPTGYIPHEFYSYPSGHSARTAFIATLLIFLLLRSILPKIEKYIFIAVILASSLIMYISRVYLGEHWLTDVIGGVLLGISLCLIPLGFRFVFKKNK